MYLALLQRQISVGLLSMAQVLVVSAHPLQDSLCQYISQTVQQELAQLGHQVTVDDLYAQQFMPCLTLEERSIFYQGIQPSTDTEPYVKRLLQAEHIVLVFPTWWYNFPAILKGWFDRVWLPEQAFSYTAAGSLQPRLDHLKTVVAITSLGSPAWYDRWIARRPIRQILRYGILASCAHAKLHYLPLYQVKDLTNSQLERHLAHIRKVLQTL